MFSGLAHLTPGNIAYVLLVIGGFCLFMATLGVVAVWSGKAPRRPGSGVQGAHSHTHAHAAPEQTKRAA